MKRLRSSDDVNSLEENGVYRDWGRRDDESSVSRSSSHRSFHYKPENGVSSSFSPRYDRIDDDHENPGFVRKRPNYDLENYERRFVHDRYRENSDRGVMSPSPRGGYVGDRIHRSESFSTPRREIPRGFRSERGRPRREGSVSSWQRFGTIKDIDAGASRWNKVELEEKGNLYFPQKNRESKSPACSKDSGSEQSKSTKMVDSRNGGASRWNKVGSEENGNMYFPEKIRKSKSPACSRDSGSEQSKSTKMLNSRNEQWKGTKITDLGSEQLNSTKMKNPENEQSKSIKRKGLGSEQLKSAKIKDFGREQSKSTKMKDSGSELSKSSTIKQLGSSKSSRIKDLGSEQSKSTKMKVLGCALSKNTKEKELGSERLKSTKMKDLGCEQSKSTNAKESGSEQLKSTKTEDLRIRQLKSTKMHDSGSEQWERTQMTMTEDLRAENGSINEMEEGELEYNHEKEATEGNDMLQNKLRSEEQADDKMVEDKARSVSSVELSKDGVGQEEQENGKKSLPEITSNKDGFHEERLKFESQRSTEDLVKAVDESAHSHKHPLQCVPVSEDVAETAGEIKGSNDENKDDPIEELRPMKGVPEEGKFINHVTEVAESGFIEPDRSVCEGSDVAEVTLSERVYSIIPSFKDKGKSVEISPTNATESNHLLNFKPDDIEGQSTRGLDLFQNHPVKQPEKQQLSGFSKPKDERLELDPFDLSLSLPNVLLPIDSLNRGPTPCSTSQARSIQSTPSSFWTNSDGFTLSMSFTGSQSIRHNPSCSLTNNSLENFEHSVSSRPLFGGKDKVSALTWQGKPSIEQSQKEVPTHRISVSNGNGFLVHDQQLKVGEGSSRPLAKDRQLSLQRQLSTNSSQSARSHENRSDHSNDKRSVIREQVFVGKTERQQKTASSNRSNDRKEEQLVSGGVDSVEPIITMIVSEPVHVIAKKFNEMNEQAVVRLKNGVSDILVNANKQWQLSLFQKALNNRSEITLETLLKANRAQLEIMVALKTGASEFLQRNQNISSSDMAEIYLNLRCQNLTCRNLLPVDECDCKVCSQKNGFCSNCMCLVCSKYDMASNTCSWVGCDVCLHWCHADCALRKSYIRSGPSACGSHGFREMQFHCVACDHPSEMFGFVKEVFQTFAKEWTGEKLSKELEYVRKIFSASEDLRGKRLHEIALSMLSTLANKSDFAEVQTFVLSFFAEGGSLNSDSPAMRSGKELFNNNPEGNNKIAAPSQERTWHKLLSFEKAPQLEKASSFRSHQKDSSQAEPDLQRSAPKEHAFDELDRIVQMKEAEAKMFQTRADDARREGEGLKRIATAKNQRIEEEYANRISKLQLPKAEEMRRKKIEELQDLERAHREYLNMKMRITGDIRDLLSKMEATKQKFAL